MGGGEEEALKAGGAECGGEAFFAGVLAFCARAFLVGCALVQYLRIVLANRTNPNTSPLKKTSSSPTASTLPFHLTSPTLARTSLTRLINQILKETKRADRYALAIGQIVVGAGLADGQGGAVQAGGPAGQAG